MQYRICRPTIFAFAVECNRRNIINDTFQGLDPKNIEPQKIPGIRYTPLFAQVVSKSCGFNQLYRITISKIVACFLLN